MGKPNTRKPPSDRTNLASCTLATIFLIFLIIIIFIVYFTLIKPKDPNLTVNAVRVLAFSVANATVRLTFSQYVAVGNPNRSVFSHYDSSIQLLYGDSQVGFTFIPAGEIAAGKTQFMATTFPVRPFPLVSAPSAVVPEGLPEQQMGTAEMNGPRVGSSMEVELRIEMAGRVRILHFFNHHVVARVQCKVVIGVRDGSVLGFHC